MEAVQDITLLDHTYHHGDVQQFLPHVVLQVDRQQHQHYVDVGHVTLQHGHVEVCQIINCLK